jgi:DNA-binding NarL/FixJ family response regulator
MLVDDHDVVREGIRSLLQKRGDFGIVAQASSVAEAIDEARRTRPDVVVMDLRLPDGSGIEACREIRAESPETRVLMLTSYADDEAVLSAVMAGASGYLLKQTRSKDLMDALERVAKGESLLDPSVTNSILERLRNGPDKDDELALLSEQEQKILDLIADGKTNKEIAAEVFLSDKTVKNYVSSILSKLSVRRRSEAAAFIARKRSQRSPES